MHIFINWSKFTVSPSTNLINLYIIHNESLYLIIYIYILSKDDYDTPRNNNKE